MRIDNLLAMAQQTSHLKSLPDNNVDVDRTKVFFARDLISMCLICAPTPILGWGCACANETNDLKTHVQMSDQGLSG